MSKTGTITDAGHLKTQDGFLEDKMIYSTEMEVLESQGAALGGGGALVYHVVTNSVKYKRFIQTTQIKGIFS
jgi:hypothetical protein